MAISMIFPDYGRKQELDRPDFVSALKKGMELGYLPRTHENTEYGKELANKINEAKARHAEEMELENLKHIRAQTGGLNQSMAKARFDMEQNRLFQNLLSGKNYTTKSSTGNESYIPSISPGNTDNLGQNINQGLSNNNTDETVMNPGSPELQHINDIYERYPQYRKKLEGLGFKKTQSVKYDPKTGTTSIITTMPNGEVRVKTSANEGDNSPATIATKTAAQKTITAITNARPILEKLIRETENGEVPGQWIGKYFQPDTQAEYESDVIQSSDTLAGALGFPGTGEGLHQAAATVLRKPRESDKGYANRLKVLIADIDKREQTAKKNLHAGVSFKEPTKITKEQALAELERRRTIGAKQ